MGATTAAEMRRAWAGIGLVAAMLATRAPAQGPRVELAFGAGAAASSLPAIAWLCGTVLPLRSEWPDSLPPETSFVVSIDDDGISIAAN